VLVGALVCTASTRANAQAPDDRQVAHEEYERGSAAFEAHDYLRAATLFLAAYRHVKHHDPLWNAARAFELAGERVRAANLYTRYLEEAPPDAKDRDRATTSRKELAAMLGRIDVQAPDVTDVRIDSEPLDLASTFVNPGQHVVRGRAGSRDIRIVRAVEAGEVASVFLDAHPPRPSPSRTGETAASAPSRGARVLPPAVAYVGSGLVLVGAGLVTWSGIDTLHAKKEYEAGRMSFDQGRAREMRTNTLFWATAGLTALTAVTAIWFVDFRGGRATTRVGAGPGTLRLECAF
jgi:hypothetical protein